MRRSRPVRYLAYALAFVLMLVEEGARGLRAGYDLWLTMVQQSEAGHRRNRALTHKLLSTPLPFPIAPQFGSAQAVTGFSATSSANSAANPLPANTAKTIKFRRHPMDAIGSNRATHRNFQ